MNDNTSHQQLGMRNIQGEYKLSVDLSPTILLVHSPSLHPHTGVESYLLGPGLQGTACDQTAVCGKLRAFQLNRPTGDTLLFYLYRTCGIPGALPPKPPVVVRET